MNRDYLEKLDKELKLLLLTFDPVFKGIFGTNLELLKDFLLLVLEFAIDKNRCNIRLLNNELPKENYKEYSKTLDVNILLNENIYIEIEINKSDFKKVKLRNYMFQNKIFSMLLNRGEKVKGLENIFFYQLNLNTEDKTEKNGEHIIVPFDMTIGEVYLRNSVTVLKYLEFYLY